MISQYTKKKVPAFFQYAKDKPITSCEPKNQSVVNMLEDIIENKRMCFTAQDIGRFDYRDMMADRERQIDIAVVNRFIEMDGTSYRKISASNNDGDVDYGYLKISILKEMEEIAGSVEAACDMLIKHLFTKKTVSHKSTFWLCFGETVLHNLQMNISPDLVQCARCGMRMRRSAHNQLYCKKCTAARIVKRLPKQQLGRYCIDCGAEIECPASSRKVRCDECQVIHRRKYKTEHMRKSRAGEIEHTEKPPQTASDTRLNTIYRGMIWRCENDKRYVDKGINVCKQWAESFDVFKKWAYENGYEDGLTIDRINNSGNYSPKNCRWTTMKVQANNKSNTIMLEYNGEIHTIPEWSDITGIRYATIRNRYKRGLPMELVLKNVDS